MDKNDDVNTRGSVKRPPRVPGTLRKEILSALATLGFARPRAARALDEILASGEAGNVEELIKLTLKHLTGNAG
jgi:Holliday junction resolvasome RuvABC DNA-binding subunit